MSDFQPAMMVNFYYKMEHTHLLISLKALYLCAMMMSMVQCVMTSGMTLRQTLFVHSLDSQMEVELMHGGHFLK